MIAILLFYTINLISAQSFSGSTCGGSGGQPSSPCDPHASYNPFPQPLPPPPQSHMIPCDLGQAPPPPPIMCQPAPIMMMPAPRMMPRPMPALVVPSNGGVDQKPKSVSGSTSKCGGTGADPIACGKASVLRGQSHIGIPAACFNKVDPGPCSQDLIRIYYDYTTYTCKAFSYSGCGGNANRFVSIKNCYKLCHPYYRQRFISLGSPSDNSGGGDGKPDSPDSPSSKKEAPTRERDPTTEGTESTVPETTTEEETTTTTTTTITTPEPTTTEEDRGVLYFNSLDGKKTEVKPEIQVVHEYDAFAQPQPGAIPGAGGLYGQTGGSPLYAQPAGGMMPGAAGGMGGGQNGGHGYLVNIQHENETPKLDHQSG